MSYYTTHYLNNPITYPHYPYLQKMPHLYIFGETPEFTLISPLFRSLSPQTIQNLLNNYYTAEYIDREIERVEKGEWMEDGVGDAADFLNLLLLNLQNSVKTIRIVDTQTGEIKCQIQITPENLGKNVEELLHGGSFDIFDIYVTEREGAGFPSPYADSLEYREDEIFEFDGYFSSKKKKPQTYIFEGIRKHRPPINSLWSEHDCSPLKTGWFVDAESGITTDEFYGDCNDFNDWFLSYVSKQKRFFCYIHPTDGYPTELIQQVKCWLNGERLTFRCNKTGKWRLIGRETVYK